MTKAENGTHENGVHRTRTKAAEGHNIRNWRIYKGYATHEALALATVKYDPKGLGIARNVIGRLESGDYAYHQRHIDILAKTLGVAPRDLIGTDPFNSGDIFTVYALANLRQRKEATEIFLKAMHAAKRR